MAAIGQFQSVRFGNYLLVSQLGRGGMAEVFKARSAGVHGFEKVVCIKRILRQHSEDAHFVEMFVNEAKISARLSHPNIVQVHELGEVDGEFFMAMEFVHGRDLLRVLRAPGLKGQPPHPVVCAYIAREMCRALAHAHDHVGDDRSPQPIIHRDVSPQNVMISYDGIVKLCDFGIAKAAQQSGAEETRTGALKGKFAYMAPEQLDGQRASAVTDTFAAGVTLFEMLTGQRLFKGNTDYDTLVRVKTQPVPAPSSINPLVPPELDRIIAVALDRNPTNRYQRASQMARELELFCGRAGFTEGDMKDFMRTLFPQHEEVPDGVALQQSSLSMSGARPSGAGEQRRIPAPAAVTPRSVAAVARRRSTGGVVGALIGVLAIAGAGGYVFLRGGRVGPPSASSSPAAASPEPATAGIAAPQDKSAPVTAAAATEVQLASNPPGAEVLDGPKVLGTTPVTLRLTGPRPTLAVRLVRSGYDDLAYEVTAADAPQLTLKLNRRRGSAADKKGAAPPPADDHSAPKIKSIDDIDQPAVKTIDE